MSTSGYRKAGLLWAGGKGRGAEAGRLPELSAGDMQNMYVTVMVSTVERYFVDYEGIESAVTLGLLTSRKWSIRHLCGRNRQVPVNFGSRPRLRIGTVEAIRGRGGKMKGSFDGFIGIVGATGAVGRKMGEVLAEKGLLSPKTRFFASKRSAGVRMDVGEFSFTVEELTKEAMGEGFDYLLFSAGAGVSLEYAPIAAKAASTVIDNSSAWRMHEGIPLVVPSVNGHILEGYRGIIANPNCSTIQMVIPLKTIHELFGLEKVVVSTYQAVSGSGQKGISELKRQISGDDVCKVYSRRIAFNCVPHVDLFLDNGYTKEEVKMINETRKILGLPHLAVEATTVRVPVWNGHSESVYVETSRPIVLEELTKAWESEPGLRVFSRQEAFPTVLDVQNQDDVFVGRIRLSLHRPDAVNFWVVADNLRRGAASNAVEILELLVSQETQEGER